MSSTQLEAEYVNESPIHDTTPPDPERHSAGSGRLEYFSRFHSIRSRDIGDPNRRSNR